MLHIYGTCQNNFPNAIDIVMILIYIYMIYISLHVKTTRELLESSVTLAITIQSVDSNTSSQITRGPGIHASLMKVGVSKFTLPKTISALYKSSDAVQFGHCIFTFLYVLLLKVYD